MDVILHEIEKFTDQAHGSQTRKYSPDRYIVHPMRVMRICEGYTQATPVLAAAILHDVLEDTPIHKNELARFLHGIMAPREAERTMHLVVELTDVFTKQAYPTWNRRKRKAAEAKRIAANSPEAQTIKYADILDNCMGISGHDADFAPVFLHECRQLLNMMDKGDAALKKRAESVIAEELNALSKKR
ncbi:HD domain-containing protein [Chitinophaga caseinilytica]|uniref:HD domain-containing protein n=1 Tax=Chitinophaga caseinilytica TaxID=2267521 RepID=UPI003C300612